MGDSFVSRRSFLALPFASLALASRWDEARFPDWTETLVDKMLTDSPWARPWRGTAVVPVKTGQGLAASFAQIGGGWPSQIPGVGWPRTPGSGRVPAPAPSSRPSGPLAVRMGVDLIIRWASALPVRRAMALQEFGRGGLDQPGALELLNTPPEHFVIELAGLPSSLVNAEFERNLAKARLVLPGGKMVKPAVVDLPAFGVNVNATLRFPRSEQGVSEDGRIELYVQAGTLSIEEKFKPRQMMYEGRLEL